MGKRENAYIREAWDSFRRGGVEQGRKGTMGSSEVSTLKTPNRLKRRLNVHFLKYAQSERLT